MGSRSILGVIDMAFAGFCSWVTDVFIDLRGGGGKVDVCDPEPIRLRAAGSISGMVDEPAAPRKDRD